MLRKLLILLIVFTTAGCATHAATSGRVVVRDDQAPAGLAIEDRDRAVVTEYYRAAKRRGALSGLAKAKPLPPGFAKRDILPRRHNWQPLPVDLEVRLTPLPGAYMRVLVGRDMLLMHRNTRLVLDIMYRVAG